MVCCKRERTLQRVTATAPKVSSHVEVWMCVLPERIATVYDAGGTRNVSC